MTTATTGTDFIQPFSVDIDLLTGAMSNPDRHLVRRASDMKGYYADEPALQKLIAAGNPVHYEVFEKAIPESPGHLLLCISKLLPGRVGREVAHVVVAVGSAATPYSAGIAPYGIHDNTGGNSLEVDHNSVYIGGTVTSGSRDDDWDETTTMGRF